MQCELWLSQDVNSSLLEISSMNNPHPYAEEYPHSRIMHNSNFLLSVKEET